MRKHLHSRAIDCRGYEREDGLWDIEAHLVDSKTYSFESKDRGHVASGEPVHDMWIRLTVDENLVVQNAEAATDAGPFIPCGDVTAKFDSLNGLKIAPGWRKAVYERMGGVQGCTHLNDLLTGPLAVAAFHTVSAARAQRKQGQAPGQKPAILDTCHALASDGPVVARDWPEHFTGKKPA
ncbi:MAG: DUF2889 domain-containing protein [Rhodospirillales bacterium]